MNGRPQLFLITFAALICIVAGTGYAATLKIATLAPEGTTWMKEMRKGAEEIGTRTARRVKFKFYPGGVMGNDRSVMRKIRIGQLQGGALTSGELANVYPDMQIYSMPLIFGSYAEVDYVRERMDDMLKAGLEQKGMIALGLSEGGFVYIMCKKPLRRIDDLKGQKVWIPEGDILAKTVFDIVRVSPVSLPLADVYTGLQTGLLDTVGSPPMATIAFQWHTKLTNLTDVPLMYLLGALVVDNKAFRRLSPGDQAIVREVMGRVFRRLEKLNRDDNEEALMALKRHGFAFDYPNEEEIKHWHAVAREAQERILSADSISSEMFDLLKGHLDDFRAGSTNP